MISRERILKALKGEKTDRVPWIPLCSRTFFLSLPEYREKFPYEWWREDGGITEDLEEEELKFRIEFYKSIGADFLQWGGECIEIKRNVEIKQEKKGNDLIIRYRTPVGNLEETFTFTEESQTLYRRDFLLKSADDFKTYKYVLEHTELKEKFTSVRNQLRVTGENGVIFAWGVAPALHRYVNDLLSIEELVFLLSDGSRELKELFEIQENINVETANLFSESPFIAFLHQATWDIGRISPKIYEEYYAPFFGKYNRILHDKNKLCLDHLSGQKIKPYLELIEACDFDGIYGFVFPPAKGDVPLRELAKRWKGVGTLPVAGIDPDVLAVSKPEEIEDRVKRIFEEVGDNPFILGTADDVVYNTPVKNLEIVAETVRKLYR